MNLITHGCCILFVYYAPILILFFFRFIPLCCDFIVDFDLEKNSTIYAVIYGKSFFFFSFSLSLCTSLAGYK